MSKVTVALGTKLNVVGQLWFSSEQKRQSSRFEYDKNWLENKAGFPISPDLPLQSGGNFRSASISHSEEHQSPLHGCFQDASPDSWGRELFRRYAGQKFLTEIDYLIESRDYSRQGALRILDEHGEPLTIGESQTSKLSDLPQLVKQVTKYENDPNSDEMNLSILVASTGSLGGARPKANIEVDDELWIAKFTSAFDTKPIERAEIATLNLAKKCGLNTPEAKLILENSPNPVALIKRFDRQNSIRFPYMSARTALNSIHEESFYTSIADVIREISEQFQKDLRELWQRIVFTILVSNTDDHLKNHGFIYDRNGRWKLSPLFDVNPSPQRHKQLKTGIIEGEPFDPSISLAIEAAYYFDIEESEAKQIACSMAKTITENWKNLFRLAGASNSEIRIYEDAFEHLEMENALKLL